MPIHIKHLLQHATAGREQMPTGIVQLSPGDRAQQNKNTMDPPVIRRPTTPGWWNDTTSSAS